MATIGSDYQLFVQALQTAAAQNVYVAAITPNGTLQFPSPKEEVLTLSAGLTAGDTTMTVTTGTSYFLPAFDSLVFPDGGGAGVPRRVQLSADVPAGSTSIPIVSAPYDVAVGDTTARYIKLPYGINSASPEAPISSASHFSFNAIDGAMAYTPTSKDASISLEGAFYNDDTTAYVLSYIASKALEGYQIGLIIEDQPMAGYTHGNGWEAFGYFEGSSQSRSSTEAATFSSTLRLSKLTQLNSDQIEALLTV